MKRINKFRYGTAVFYSLFSFLISSPELAIVILPFLVYTERRLNWKIRFGISMIFLFIMSLVFMIAIPLSVTLFRMIIILSLFLAMVLFEDMEYVNTKDGERWIITVSALLLEFCVITFILSHIQGVMW